MKLLEKLHGGSSHFQNKKKNENVEELKIFIFNSKELVTTRISMLLVVI
jgi:hypothetical protein